MSSTNPAAPTKDPDPFPQDPTDEGNEAPLEDPDIDIDMTAAPEQAPVGANFDSNNNPLDALDPPPDPRIPTRKDMSLREFLGKMDEYAPIIPDAVTAHHLTLAGLPPPPTTNSTTPTDPSIPHTPLHLSRLLALATQKFIADIAADAYQYSRMRSSNTTSNNPMNTLGIVSGSTAGVVLPSTTASAQQQNPAGGLGPGARGKAEGGRRGGSGGAGNAGHVLGAEGGDLGMAVGEYGVNLRRGEFYR
ncbi:MAG: transcription initiation factor tfiid subunit 10 [Lasallia pustulata]|uniref:Transcription initiation factor tfiid subunit 10 n=1 Tax=Lasallia pustulata TaxID=136370 RepID=A0A5M8PC89_9LECA|nr:MAG: transcription initiation factor tfiid subunit 10 [Lasallia pustulata]